MTDRRSRAAAGEASGEAGRGEKLYAMVLEAIPSSVLLIDPQLRIVSANRNFLDKARRSESDTIGQRIDAVFPPVIVHQMDLIPRIRRAIELDEPTRGGRMTYRAPGLATRIYYYSLLPFRWRDRVEHVMLLLEDVTEQVRLGEEARRAERHLASVVESASDLVVSADVEARILTWNSAAEKVSGYNRDEVRGRPFLDLCAAAQQSGVREAFSTAARGRGFAVAEWDLITKAGLGVPVAWVGSPMKDDGTRVVGIVAVGRDLTEQRKLEAQLLQSQKLAALGVLAGGIAHEIRNPLTISASAAQFLLEGPDDPGFRAECAGKVVAGIHRASAIIESLLRFARPGAGAEVQPVDLAAVVRDALALVANQSKLQQVETVVALPDYAVRVSGAPSLLQQAFMNLLINALDAMPDGGRLRVGLQQTDTEGLVRISDTGHGIPAGEIEKIFDPFYTTKPVGRGTGLGLSVCYSIVRQHFGLIDVESTVGRGSTFTVRLPLLAGG